MEIYKGPFLNIYFEKDTSRFVQNWMQSPELISDFKKELLEFVSLINTIRPKQTLWLQKSFKLKLDREVQFWIEENVNKPCLNWGVEMLAFVVGDDVLAHMDVIDIFEETGSALLPKHFATERDAKVWLDSKRYTMESNNNLKVEFEGLDTEGNSVIKLTSPTVELTNTIRSLKTLLDENKFIKSNLDKYVSLTVREKKILSLYAKGKKHKDIAKILSISLSTVQTHWRNIKKKLEISSFRDIINYATAFNLK